MSKILRRTGLIIGAVLLSGWIHGATANANPASEESIPAVSFIEVTPASCTHDTTRVTLRVNQPLEISLQNDLRGSVGYQTVTDESVVIFVDREVPAGVPMDGKRAAHVSAEPGQMISFIYQPDDLLTSNRLVATPADDGASPVVNLLFTTDRSCQ